jgi:hypothetical protein
MKLARTSKPIKTFSQRLVSAMVWWGIPMVALELIGIAKRYWVPVLFLAVPATMVGVFVGAVVEHNIVKRLEQKRTHTSEGVNT